MYKHCSSGARRLLRMGGGGATAPHKGSCGARWRSRRRTEAAKRLNANCDRGAGGADGRDGHSGPLSSVADSSTTVTSLPSVTLQLLEVPSASGSARRGSRAANSVRAARRRTAAGRCAGARWASLATAAGPASAGAGPSGCDAGASGSRLRVSTCCSSAASMAYFSQYAHAAASSASEAAKKKSRPSGNCRPCRSQRRTLTRRQCGRPAAASTSGPVATEAPRRYNALRGAASASGAVGGCR